MISIKSSGSFDKTQKFLKFVADKEHLRVLEKYGPIGVDALARATPVESGLTASSWTFELKITRGRVSLIWKNTNVVNGVPIAIILQYGHGTGTGGWVEGRDYINPAIQPIFDQIANEVWEEVRRA